MNSTDIAYGLGLQAAFERQGYATTEICRVAAQSKHASVRLMGERLGAAYLAARAAPAQTTKLAQIIRDGGHRVPLRTAPAGSRLITKLSQAGVTMKTASDWSGFGMPVQLHGEAALQPWYSVDDSTSRFGEMGAAVRGVELEQRVYGPDGFDPSRSMRTMGAKLAGTNSPEYRALMLEKDAALGGGAWDVAKTIGAKVVGDAADTVRQHVGNAAKTVGEHVGNAADAAGAAVRKHVPHGDAIMDAGNAAADVVQDGAARVTNAVNAVREKLPDVAELGQVATDAVKQDPGLAERAADVARSDGRGALLGAAALTAAGGTLAAGGAGGLLYYKGRRDGAEKERGKPMLQRLFNNPGAGGVTGALAGAARGYVGL